jgi:hypothetical protein
VVDGGGLENRCTRKGTGGSNPSPSARLHGVWYLAQNRLGRRTSLHLVSYLFLITCRNCRIADRIKDEPAAPAAACAGVERWPAQNSEVTPDRN